MHAYMHNLIACMVGSSGSATNATIIAQQPKGGSRWQPSAKAIAVANRLQWPTT